MKAYTLKWFPNYIGRVKTYTLILFKPKTNLEQIPHIAQWVQKYYKTFLSVVSKKLYTLLKEN